MFNIVFAWEGAVAVTTDEEQGLIASHRFPMFAPRADRADPRYFCYFFGTSAGLALLGRNSPGAAGRNRTLDRAALFKEKVLIPPLEEQTRTVAFLSHEIAQIDALIAKIEEHVALLTEHRQALIAAAVTGQIDVREEVPR